MRIRPGTDGIELLSLVPDSPKGSFLSVALSESLRGFPPSLLPLREGPISGGILDLPQSRPMLSSAEISFLIVVLHEPS
jgi:hypothetical protein